MTALADVARRQHPAWKQNFTEGNAELDRTTPDYDAQEARAFENFCRLIGARPVVGWQDFQYAA